MRGHDRSRTRSCNGIYETPLASYSPANHTRRTDENNAGLSAHSSRSERWAAEPRRPAWLPQDTWSHVTDSVGDTPPAYKPSADPQPRLSSPTAATAASDDTPRSNRTSSTYDSHPGITGKMEPLAPEAGSHLISIDRWISQQPIVDITNRPYLYHSQLIRQRTNEPEKNIVWIYSYKNRHLFTDDDYREDSASPTTVESEKSDHPNLDTDPPCINSPEQEDQAVARCDSWSCYDTRLKGSPRFPNTCTPVYIPSLKLAATRFSLETVAEDVETERSDAVAVEALVNPHISVETLQSVKRWIDGSTRDVNSPHRPTDDQSEGKRTFSNDSNHRIELDVSANKPPHIGNLSPPKKVGTFAVANDKIDTEDWITESVCIDISPKHPVEPNTLQRRSLDNKIVMVGNTACPEAGASSRLHAKAMAALRVSPWDVYYSSLSPRVSEVVDISLTISERREMGCLRKFISCFCKCFGHRK